MLKDVLIKTLCDLNPSYYLRNLLFGVVFCEILIAMLIFAKTSYIFIFIFKIYL